MNTIRRKKKKQQPEDTGIPTSLYLSLSGLVNMIEQCNDPKELKQIYQDNRKRIDADESVRKMVRNKIVTLSICAIAYG